MGDAAIGIEGARAIPGASRISPAACVLAGHVALAAALFWSDGFDQWPALLLVIAALGAWVTAVIGVMNGARTDVAGMERWAWAGALVSVALSFARPPAQHAARDALGPFHAMAAAALLLVASYGVDLFRGPLPRAAALARRAMLFALAVAIGAWVMRASPNPPIDLFPLHQQAAQAMLQGKSIYEPGVTNTLVTFVGQPNAIVDEYTYLPLGAIWTTIAYALAGDIRWANLAGIVVGAALIGVAARRAYAGAHGRDDARAGVWADLVVAMLLFHPRGWMVLELAWTEPMSLPFLAGFAVAYLARRRVLACVCLGLLAAGKQHLVLYVPFLMMCPGIGLTGALLAGAVAIATLVPFALRSPHGFLRGVWLLHKNGPFRGDSLSITGELSSIYVLKPWVGFVAAVIPFAAIPKLPRRVAPLLLGACTTFLMFYLFGRQAFLNYYWFLDATALLALATLPDGTSAPPARRGQHQEASDSYTRA